MAAPAAAGRQTAGSGSPGRRDPFGSKAELDEVTLPAHVSLTYLEDGNHDFGPRGKSLATLDGNIKLAAEAVRAFVDRLTS